MHGVRCSLTGALPCSMASPMLKAHLVVDCLEELSSLVHLFALRTNGHLVRIIGGLTRRSFTLCWLSNARLCGFEIVCDTAPRSIWEWIRELLSRAPRMLEVHGLSLTLLGPDGAGKSTLAAALAECLAPLFRATEVHHLRFGIILRARPGGNVREPHALPARKPLLSSVQPIAWWLEYTAAFLGRVLPSMLRCSLLIFDRHAVDLLVDPRRYRYGGPTWLANAVTRLIPSPELILLLDADAHTLRQRKQELDEAETQRQCEAYRALVSSARRGRIIDARGSRSEVLAAAGEAILTHMAERSARRHALWR